MTTLRQLYEEVDGKTASSLVLVDGQPCAIDELDVSATMGAARVASFVVTNPPPPRIVIGVPAIDQNSTVQIFTGYNGLLNQRFNGIVTNIVPGAVTTRYECTGTGRLLKHSYQRLIRTISAEDANDVIASLLDAAGVTNYSVHLPEWIIGAVVTGVLEFENYGDAIDDVALVDGSPWFEIGSGQIRVEVRDPWPAITVFRRYFAGALSQLDADQRLQMINGTLPAVDLQPPAIVAAGASASARPRIRPSISQIRHYEAVKNRIRVMGSVLDIEDENGASTSQRLEGAAQGASPWIETPPGFRDEILDFPLIDTQAKVISTAVRYFLLANNLAEEVPLPVDGDPEIELGMTVQVEDPDYTGITGNWFVNGFREHMSPSEYTTSLDLRGGIASGVTPQVNPVADFIATRGGGTFTAIRQVIPGVGAGNIVVFDGRISYDPDGTIANYEWNDDQGNTVSGADKAVIQLAYDEAITAVVMTLTVTDNDGLTDSITKTIRVSDTNACGDTAFAVMFAAADTYLMGTLDGGENWEDTTPASAGTTPTAVAVAATSELSNEGGNPDAPNYAMAVVNRSDGWVIRQSGDGGATWVSSGVLDTTIVKDVIWGGLRYQISPEPTNVPDNRWWACTSDGSIHLLGSQASVTTPFDGVHLGPLIHTLNPQLTAPVNRIYTKVLGNQVWLWAAGGDTANPASLVQLSTDAFNTLLQFTGPALTVRPNPVVWNSLPITGALAAAVAAAGPGHSVVGIAFTSPGLPNWEAATAVTIMFGSGVSPRVWHGEITFMPPSSPVGLNVTVEWTPAVGTPSATGLDIAGGIDAVVAVFDGDLTTYNAPDGINFTAGAAAPSQIRRAVWEGMPDVYLAALDDGIAKTLDGGATWGYIRPETGVTAWPGAANGKAVALITQTPPPCAQIFAIGNSLGGADASELWALSNRRWAKVADLSGEAFGLRYFEEGHFLHLVNDDVPQISSDFGVTWGAAAAPDGTHVRCHDIQADASRQRLWGLWRDGNGSSDGYVIARSDDFGATWETSYDVGNDKPYTIACHPSDPMRLVAAGAVVGNLNPFIWISLDGGASWTRRAGPAGLALASLMNFPARSAGYIGSPWLTWTPYGRILYFGDVVGNVGYSDDAGINWTLATVPGWTSSAPLQIFRIGTFGPFFAVAGNNRFMRSLDFGLTWTNIVPPVAVSFGGLAYNPLVDALIAQQYSDAAGGFTFAAIVAPLTNVSFQDWTYNFDTDADVGLSLQSLAFVHDPQTPGT